MASTSHGHSALRPYTVQLVCGSPFKQEKQVINIDRSFHDVFDALEWDKGYSLLRVDLCESLNDSSLPAVANLHSSVSSEIEWLATVSKVVVIWIWFTVRKQAPPMTLLASPCLLYTSPSPRD